MIINICFVECVFDFNCMLLLQLVSVSFGLYDLFNEVEVVYLLGDFGLIEMEFFMIEMVFGDGEWFVSFDLFFGIY